MVSYRTAENNATLNRKNSIGVDNLELRRFPSARRTESPPFYVFAKLPYVVEARSAFPKSVSATVIVKREPVLSTHAPPSNLPSRIFGPCRSSKNSHMYIHCRGHSTDALDSEGHDPLASRARH